MSAINMVWYGNDLFIIIIIIIFFHCRQTVHILIKKIVKTYSNTITNNSNRVSQNKRVQINIILISIIVKWESQYKQLNK